VGLAFVAQSRRSPDTPCAPAGSNTFGQEPDRRRAVPRNHADPRKRCNRRSVLVAHVQTPVPVVRKASQTLPFADCVRLCRLISRFMQPPTHLEDALIVFEPECRRVAALSLGLRRRNNQNSGNIRQRRRDLPHRLIVGAVRHDALTRPCS